MVTLRTSQLPVPPHSQRVNRAGHTRTRDCDAFEDRRGLAGLIRPFDAAKDASLITDLIRNTSRASLETKIMQSVHERRFESALEEEHARMTRNLPKLTAVLLAIVRHPDASETASIAELDAGGENTCEMSFHVHETDQGHGIGTKLVDAALTEAHRRGLDRAVVHVWQTNDGMLSIFKKAGFRQTASGNGEIVMEKDLASPAPYEAPALSSRHLFAPLAQSSKTIAGVGRSPMKRPSQPGPASGASSDNPAAFQDPTTKVANARA